MDPLEHYLRFGRAEGRKPCLSKVDYSRLTPERLAAFHAAPAGDVVVCTAIAGGYERLLPPAFLNDGWRYVCYADTPMESYGIWDVRPIPYDNADPTRKARWVKLHLPELFPDARWVLWLDAISLSQTIFHSSWPPATASCLCIPYLILCGIACMLKLSPALKRARTIRKLSAGRSRHTENRVCRHIAG